MRGPPPTALTALLLAVWAGFCLLTVLEGLQERWYAGQTLSHRPLFCAMSAVAAAT